MVPMKNGGRQAERRQPRRESHARTGRQQGSGLRDAIGIRMARMPPESDAEQRGEQLSRETGFEGGEGCDGAKDNWTFLSGELPAEKIGRRAPRHGSGGCLWRHPSEAQCPVKLRHVLLEAKGVEKVIVLSCTSATRIRADCPRAEVFSAQSASNARRAQETRSADRFITEAACKTLATQRLKRSGMRWGEQGGQAILSFRALVQKSLRSLDPAHTYKAEVTALDNDTQCDDR